MSSLLRKLKKRAAESAVTLANRKRKAELAGFEAERKLLFLRLREYANECGELDAVRFLAFLKNHRRGYDPRHDGASKYMQLVDDIEALDALEKDWAEKNVGRDLKAGTSIPDATGEA